MKRRSLFADDPPPAEAADRIVGLLEHDTTSGNVDYIAESLVYAGTREIIALVMAMIAKSDDLPIQACVRLSDAIGKHEACFENDYYLVPRYKQQSCRRYRIRMTEMLAKIGIVNPALSGA